MSVDEPERPTEQEILESQTPDNGSSQGDDGPGHTTMEDIDAADAADSSSGGGESADATDGASEDLEEPVDGNRETEKPEADGDGALAEPIDSESPDHGEAGHVTAGDMDALGVAEDDAHDGDIWDRPLTSEDRLSAPADDGSAIGGDLDEQGIPGKPSAETAVADQGAPPPETAGHEEPAAPEEATDTTPRESEEGASGKPAEEQNGSHKNSEEPAERPGPDDDSADVRGRDDSAEDPRPEKTPTGEQEAPVEAPWGKRDSADTSRETGEQAEPPATDTGGHRDDLIGGGHGTGEHEDHAGDHSGDQKDDGEAEDANEPDARSEEDGEAGDPETGDQSENPLADGPPSWQADETGEPAEPSVVDVTNDPYDSDDGASDELSEPEEPPEPDRLAVATDREVDLSRLGVDVVWREGREPLYRSDNREPADVFESGFEPRDTSNTDLREYVAHDDPSAFVSTSYREDIGDDFGGKYTYEIDAPGGIDVNKTLGEHQLAYEEEVSFPGGVRSEYIKSAMPYEYTTGELGEPIPNPNYIPEGERVRDN